MTNREHRLLVRVNRGLTLGIICMAIVSGYLFSKDRGWLKPAVKNAETVPVPSPIPGVSGKTVTLPKADTALQASLRSNLQHNIPHHAYTKAPLSLKEISALLWAAQGQITPWGDRTAPSYKSLYPLHLSVLVRRADGIAGGIYRYGPHENQLLPVETSGQPWIEVSPQPNVLRDAPVVIGVSANMTGAGWDRDRVYLEAGQVVENIYLAIQNLGLGGVMIPDFEAGWQQAMRVASPEQLLLLLPVGKPNDIQAGPANIDRGIQPLSPSPKVGTIH